MSGLVQIGNAQKTGREYWRSLEELAGTAKFKDWVEKEFPGGVELLGSGSRRTVLKIMAAAFGLAGLTACRRPVERIMPITKGVEDLLPGEPKFYATAFVHGGVASGVLVESHDYRPTKVEGNRNHPYSLGAASAFAQASLLSLYDPDRAQKVLRKGEASSWDDFRAQTQQLAASLGDGAKLRILSGRVASPSLEAVRAQLRQKFPSAKWVEYEPVNHSEAARGVKMAFGRALQPHYHLDKADVVVSLDSDFLGLDSLTILPVKQFSAARRVEEAGKMNRLYVVEGNFTTTGAMADHRLRSRVADVGQVALALAKQLNVAGDELNVLQPSADASGKMVAAMAKDLVANRGKSIVIAGPRQPAAVHALVWAINHALGNLGETITFTRPPFDADRDPVAAIAALAGEMSRGGVNTLLIFGGNPAYDAPGDLNFGAALKKVANSIHLTVEPNETTALCEWQLPESHYLESWGDARALDGAAAIQQPLVDRLFDTRTAAEVLAMLSGYQHTKAYDIVRNYWLLQPQTNDEKKWRKAVCDGIVEGTAFPLETAAVDARAVAAAARPGIQAAPAGLEVAFYPHAGVYDGRYANNAWLQEMPDPITKLVWDNAALVSPKTAASLGVQTGDLLTVSKEGRNISVAAMVLPGHADDSLSLAVGLGRTACGRVGNNVGFNVNPLRSSREFHVTTAVKAVKAGGSYSLITAQEHFRMEGRPIIREGSLAEFQKEPDFAEKMEEPQRGHSAVPRLGLLQGLPVGHGHRPQHLHRLQRLRHGLPGREQHPHRGQGPGAPRPRDALDPHGPLLQRRRHEDPECRTSPWPASSARRPPASRSARGRHVHSHEGLNIMVYNRCIGTRYCSNNCPYKVRRFNFFNYNKDLVGHRRRWRCNPGRHGARARASWKSAPTACSASRKASRSRRRPTRRKPRRSRTARFSPPASRPAPREAIVFGDINDPDSRVAKLKRESPGTTRCWAS